MNLKKISRENAGDTEVNLTSIMNIFLILIPFLLLTASFTKIAILELSLPNLGRKSQATQTEKKKAIMNIVAIKETGFELKSPDMKFSPIPKKNQEFDLKELKAALKRIKNKYQQSEDIFIKPDSMIRYETIIHVMDQCREAGFPNISIMS